MSNNKQFTRTLEQAQERLSIVKEQEKDFNKQVSNNHKQIKQLQIKNKKIAKKISSHMKYMNQLSEEIQSNIPKQEERNYVIEFRHKGINPLDMNVSYCLTSFPITEEKYPAIKNAIEEILNPTKEVDKILEIDEAKHVEYWHNEFKVASKSLGEWIEKYCKLEKENDAMMKDVQKDWEVLEIECYGGETRRLVDGLYRVYDEGIGFDFEYLMNRTDSSIKKVKRLSDGVVFSIGDKVQGVEEILSIEKFDIEYALGNLMKVCFNEGGFYPIEKLPTPTEQANSDTLPQIDEDAFKNRCNVCGDDLVYIRGKYPNTDKRPTCPTCTTERLEQISEISNKDYGKAYQNKNQ